LGLISLLDLCAAFMPVAPQSVETESSHQYLSMLSGSIPAKAVRKMLMKLTLGVGTNENI